jgi:hypothetical protein
MQCKAAKHLIIAESHARSHFETLDRSQQSRRRHLASAPLLLDA